MNHYITGATIKALREKKGQTQAELAESLGVSDKAHAVTVEQVEDEHFVTVRHEMTKGHFLYRLGHHRPGAACEAVSRGGRPDPDAASGHGQALHLLQPARPHALEKTNRREFP